jgi:PKD repeat protein
VQNQLIPAGLPPGTYLMTSPLFVPWHPTAAPLPAQWLRITLAEQKTGGTLPPDGRGPTPGFRFGETEDYFFVPDCPLPVADFAWDPTTPCVNSPVQFWDQSSGALTWQWNFGGLGSSAAQNPSFTFTGAGSYNVTLAVTNACGSAQVTKPVTVRDCSQQSYDIWLKDSNPDDGSVPSPSPWWVSPDIWVRHDGDCTNTSHQNPIPGLATTVCIRVRNRLATSVENITVNAYYANAALALTWPGSWAYISSFTIPSLAGSAITTQSVPWNVPAITGHFCLLARADAVKDPLPSGPDTTAPVNHPPNNNNVAQKNTNVVDQAPPVQACGFYSTTLVTQRFEFDVVNTWSSSLRADVELSSSDYPAGATLVLDPGVLWGRWTGLEHLTPAGSTLELDGGLPAAMRGLLLDPSMVARVAMTITAPIDQHFAVNITQIISDTEVGGIQYLRDIPICLYLPVITKNH